MRIGINESMTLEVKTRKENEMSLAEFDMVDSLLKPFRRANELVLHIDDDEPKPTYVTRKYKKRKVNGKRMSATRKKQITEEAKQNGIPETAKKFNVKYATLWGWVKESKIKPENVKVIKNAKGRIIKWTPQLIKQFVIDSKLMTTEEMAKKYDIGLTNVAKVKYKIKCGMLK